MNTLLTALISRRGFVLLAAGFMLALAGYHDIYRPLYSAPAPDIVVIYNALLINDGLPQHLHDHPGLIQYLLYGGWFHLLKFLGAVDAAQLSDFGDANTFERDFGALVFAGRWLSTLMVFAVAVILHAGLRYMKVDEVTAFLFAVLALTSPGFVYHTLVLRVDLPAAMFTVAAFFLLLAAVNARDWQRCWYLAASAFCCTLAVSTKSQVIPLLLAFPVIAMTFGKAAEDSFSVTGAPTVATIPTSVGFAFIAACAAFAVPVFSMLIAQIVVAGKSGTYQLATAAYFIGCAYVYCRLYGISRWGLAVGLAALVAGFAAGLYVHQITQSQINGFAIANFVEHMLKLATHRQAIASSAESSSLLGGILAQVPEVLSNTTGDLLLIFSTENGFQAGLYYVVAVGTGVAFWRGKRRLGVQCLALLLTAFGMQVFSNLKYFIVSYHMFVSPWLIIAAALLASELMSQSRERRAGRAIRGAQLLPLVLIACVGLTAFGANLTDAAKERTWKTPVYACKRAQGRLPLMKHLFARYCEPRAGG